jgi:hypothetical protein
MMHSALEPDVGRPYYQLANFHRYGWIVFLTVVGAVFYASYIFGNLIGGWLIVFVMSAIIPIVLAMLDQVDFIVDTRNEHQFTVEAKAARNVRRNRQLRTTVLKGCLGAIIIPGGLLLVIFVFLFGPVHWFAGFTSDETSGMMPLLGVIGFVDLLFLWAGHSFSTDPEDLWVELRNGTLLIPKSKSEKQALPIKDIRLVIWCGGTSSGLLKVMVVPDEGYRVDFYQDQVKDEKAFKEAFGDKIKTGDGLALLMQEVGKMAQERRSEKKA